MTSDEIATLIDLIWNADETVAMTGAGISTASGIPDFRGENGIWGREFDPSAFHRYRFETDPAGFWQDRLRLQERLFGDSIGHNEAHRALCQLESMGFLEAVITQNTDGLHRQAGSESVIELHGNASQASCDDCGHRIPAAAAFDLVRDGHTPPPCARCSGVLKPDVVLFGESLPRDRLQEAGVLLDRCDLVIVAGSSLEVEPAASLPTRTVRKGGDLVIINFDPTPLDRSATLVLNADVTEVLPTVVAELERITA